MKPNYPTPRVFDELGQYWSEMADANSTGKQVEFVKNQVKAEGLVLDLACGSGRHCVALEKAGYEIVGLDVSSTLLKIAKSKSSETTLKLILIRADMRFLPFRAEVFSSVLSLDASFGYLSSEKEDLKCLLEVARVLKKGGVFLVDVFNRERVMHKFKKSFLREFEINSLERLPWLGSLFRWVKYPSFSLLFRRIADEKTETLRDLWLLRNRQTGKTTVVVHVIRLYSSSRLRMLLEGARLGEPKVFGGYEGGMYSAESNRLIMISNRI